MIEQGIYALLAGNTRLTDLLASVNGQPAIFAGAAPDDVSLYPCASYSFVGGSAEGTMETSGMIHQRIEFNGLAIQPSAYSTPKTVAAQIRGAIIAAINGWQELLADGVNVTGCQLVNPGTDFVSEQRIFRAMCEFRVHYTLPGS